MTIADLMRVYHLCSEYHWYMDELYICINNYDFNEIMKHIPADKFEDGIKAILRGGYVVIPAFDMVLDALGFDLADIKEIFKEGNNGN